VDFKSPFFFGDVNLLLDKSKQRGLKVMIEPEMSGIGEVM